MRWRSKPYPSSGDTRYRIWFAWLPVTIDDEIRWLERVIVRQRYFVSHLDGTSFWMNDEFLGESLSSDLTTSQS